MVNQLQIRDEVEPELVMCYQRFFGISPVAVKHMLVRMGAEAMPLAYDPTHHICQLRVCQKLAGQKKGSFRLMPRQFIENDLAAVGEFVARKNQRDFSFIFGAADDPAFVHLTLNSDKCSRRKSAHHFVRVLCGNFQWRGCRNGGRAEKRQTTGSRCANTPVRIHQPPG